VRVFFYLHKALAAFPVLEDGKHFLIHHD
jgi:hypothetical protein